jgi:cardiolipin synthase
MFFLINILFVIVIIFLERRNVTITWSWLIVLIFIPIFGFFLFILFGQNVRKGNFYKTTSEASQWLSELVHVQIQQIEQEQFVYKDPSVLTYRDMIYMNLTAANYSPFNQDNRVEIFTNGQEKFYELIQCIEKAKDHIHLLYYKVRNDELGIKIIKALTEKAKEGVKVRFLYDDIGSSRLSGTFFAELRKAGGEVTSFFSSKIPFLNPKINYRNHRKVVVIDGQIGFIGGINIGKEYLGLDPKIGYWRDTHLKLTGSAVHVLQAFFISDWNQSLKHFISFDPRYYPATDMHGETMVQIVASGPDSKSSHIKNAFIKMIYSAKESVYIQTPYFIPDESLLNALKIVALSGIDVKIMLPTNSIGKWAAHSYLGELMAVGVKCYFYEKGFLHAKTIVVDGMIASVGTSNFDIRSFKLNFEINAFIYDTSTTQRLQQIFIDDLSDCREENFSTFEKRSFIYKIMESISRLFSPIM